MELIELKTIIIHWEETNRKNILSTIIFICLKYKFEQIYGWKKVKET